MRRSRSGVAGLVPVGVPICVPVGLVSVETRSVCPSVSVSRGLMF